MNAIVDGMKMRVRDIDGHEVVTFGCDIVSANVLSVEAGTTGYMGGDSGHGCRTYFRIEDNIGTDITADIVNGGRGFEVVLGGDTELSTIIEALKAIVQVLNNNQNGLTEESKG